MTPLKISTYRNKTASSWLMKFSFLWLLSHNCCRASAVWTAYLNISFHVGNRMLSELGEMGVFGRSSTLKRVAGVIVPPDGRTQNACNPSTSFSRLKNSETWLALVERGGCTFTQKIKVAVEKGAGGVIIYNFPGTGNQVFPMSHQAFEDIVVVMIAYFIFYRIRRLWIARIQNRRWQRLTTDLKKAFGQLQLRVLKEGDEEISPNGDSCVVCFELYKPNDTVRILTCKHFFHKSCIDPWILAHGTCPMCKRDILKALGIQVDVEDGTESLQVLMSNELSDALSPDEEETDSELPPVRGSDEVTPLEAGAVPLPPQNDSQPTSVVEDVHPLP
ncbi:E3 ubiquitin-protein ligase RNF133 isoform X2 [Acinonyx jubatus]|uniref:E3 ubiquitin-protein ligase RNF133 isoform X2 n=1 Tax=Acinonyx jubatus TaxID=32536 RepID=A0ABM3PR33_ACIJB|nr:E3 ubiquitin-protein ligase RNF133 isoform X2 [Acinonyx jubatus]